jgi:hypothetical protein
MVWCGRSCRWGEKLRAARGGLQKRRNERKGTVQGSTEDNMSEKEIDENNWVRKKNWWSGEEVLGGSPLGGEVLSRKMK